MFLLVPAYLGSPGSKAVKWLCACVWRDARYAAQTGGSVPTCQCSAIECCDSGLTSTMNGAVAGSCGPVGAGSVNLRAGD